MTDDGIGLIEAKHAGGLAARFFEEHSRAEVVAVFERSLYLQAERAFVCLGDMRIGDGPINVIVDTAGDSSFIACSRAGQSVNIAGGIAVAPGWRLDVRGVDIWLPDEFPALAGPEALDAAIATAQEVARSMLPFDGLLPLVIGDHATAGGGGVFERLGAPRLARLESWIFASLTVETTDAAGEPPVDLLGLGPGLTPSGDDALCGVMLAMRAIGSQRAGRALQQMASAIERESLEATTALSAQFLAAASEGQGSAVLHAFVGALASGERPRIPAALAKLARVGHSSGLDAAAGAILALRAFVAASSRSTRSP